MRFLFPAMTGLLMFATGCGGCSDVSLVGGASGVGGGGGGGGDTLEPPEISWYACPEGELAEMSCADVEVPLDWDAPEGRAISIHVRRLEASGEPRGSLWLLEGGPGVPGSWMLDFAGRVHDAHPDLDVFVPDHRGTGASAALACSPQTDPPTPACMASLHEDESLLLQVNSSAAAHDVAALAEWTRRSDTLFLYGRSYGTYWAHRAVSLAPETFDALVLDSPCSPIDGCPTSAREPGVDEVGRELLAHCGDDPACAGHLGSDAESFASAVIAAADTEACSGAAAVGVTGERLRYILARLLGSEDGRGVVPALLFRYQRCSSADAQAFASVAAYFEQIDALTETALATMSIPTNYQVTFAEWWDEGFSPVEASEQTEDLIFVTGAGQRWATTFADGTWTALPRDPELRVWHIGGMPTLVLVGGLDTATPRSSVESEKPPIPDGSYWVNLAYAGHVDSAGDGAYGACARSLIDGFLAAPGAPLDQSCVAAADAAAGASLFEVPSSTAQLMLGTPDLYGD